MSNIEFANIKRRVTVNEQDIAALQANGSGVSAQLAAHISATANAHIAGAISLSSIPGLASSDVQSALLELLSNLTSHISSTNAHLARNLEIEPLSVLDAVTVQTALEQLEQTDIDNLNNLQQQIDSLNATQISVIPPVTRTYNTLQNSINVIEADIATLKNDSGDHENSINLILTSLLNQSNPTQVIQNLQNGTTPFTGITLPTSATSSPVNGSAYFDVNTKQLKIYAAGSYYSITLV